MREKVLPSYTASLGFAFFLAINATQVWGGIFPFLPTDFQTPAVTLMFHLAQSLSFVAALVASVVGSYWRPEGAKRMLVALAAAMVAAGSLCIIAAMYVSRAALVLVVAGGVALGVGTAAFFMLWQRLFSSLDAVQCNRQLMVGTVFSALLYYALYIVPAALTAFLIPAVLLPIGALCLVLCVREMDFDQPMFEDVPRDHPQVYRRLVQDCWRSAVGVGALGFAAGLARGVAVADAGSVGEVVNVASMAGSLLAAVGLLVLWRYRSARFGMNRLFCTIYPFIMTGILLFPFFQSMGLSLFAGVTYLAFSAAVLVMMMQAAQISRDRGTNPVFVYGLFAVAAYGAQSLGFLLGWLADDADVMGVGQVALLSMLASYVMGMALLLAERRRDGGRARDGQVELLKQPEAAVQAHARLEQPVAYSAVRTVLDPGPARTAAKAGPTGPKESASDQKHAPRRAQTTAAPPERFDARAADDERIRDRFSKQCLAARDAYMLSTRETEVMELIARGKSVAMIAEDLFISENTVRTHSKRIYTKLDVHSKAELAALLGSIEPAER